MKEFVVKKRTIWGMVILGLILITVAFVQVARAHPIHITADFYGSEPPAPPKTFPCNVEYLEDAVLAWGANVSPPHFNSGSLGGHPATLIVDARGVKEVVIRPLNQNSDMIILSVVDIADREPDYIITQFDQTHTIKRKDGALFDRAKLQIALELIGITPDFEPLDPDFHFVQVWETICH